MMNLGESLKIARNIFIGTYSMVKSRLLNNYHGGQF